MVEGTDHVTALQYIGHITTGLVNASVQWINATGRGWGADGGRGGERGRGAFLCR